MTTYLLAMAQLGTTWTYGMVLVWYGSSVGSGMLLVWYDCIGLVCRDCMDWYAWAWLGRLWYGLWYAVADGHAYSSLPRGG